jgi:hypothetical protein
MIMQSELTFGSDYKKEKLEDKTKNRKIAVIYQNEKSSEKN